MIRFEGVLIRKKYVGYAFVRQSPSDSTWKLQINFMNDNKEKDYIWLNYRTENEAYDKLDELEKLLCD
jgi:hypothetical protein